MFRITKRFAAIVRNAERATDTLLEHMAHGSADEQVLARSLVALKNATGAPEKPKRTARRERERDGLSAEALECA